MKTKKYPGFYTDPAKNMWYMINHELGFMLDLDSPYHGKVKAGYAPDEMILTRAVFRYGKFPVGMNDGSTVVVVRKDQGRLFFTVQNQTGSLTTPVYQFCKKKKLIRDTFIKPEEFDSMDLAHEVDRILFAKALKRVSPFKKHNIAMCIGEMEEGCVAINDIVIDNEYYHNKYKCIVYEVYCGHTLYNIHEYSDYLKGVEV